MKIRQWELKWGIWECLSALGHFTNQFPHENAEKLHMGLFLQWSLYYVREQLEEWGEVIPMENDGRNWTMDPPTGHAPRATQLGFVLPGCH